MGIWLYPKGQHKYHTELTLREGYPAFMLWVSRPCLELP